MKLHLVLTVCVALISGTWAQDIDWSNLDASLIPRDCTELTTCVLGCGDLSSPFGIACLLGCEDVLDTCPQILELLLPVEPTPHVDPLPPCDECVDRCLRDCVGCTALDCSSCERGCREECDCDRVEPTPIIIVDPIPCDICVGECMDCVSCTALDCPPCPSERECQAECDDCQWDSRESRECDVEDIDQCMRDCTGCVSCDEPDCTPCQSDFECEMECNCEPQWAIFEICEADCNATCARACAFGAAECWECVDPCMQDLCPFVYDAPPFSREDDSSYESSGSSSSSSSSDEDSWSRDCEPAVDRRECVDLCTTDCEPPCPGPIDCEGRCDCATPFDTYIQCNMTCSEDRCSRPCLTGGRECGRCIEECMIEQCPMAIERIADYSWEDSWSSECEPAEDLNECINECDDNLDCVGSCDCTPPWEVLDRCNMTCMRQCETTLCNLGWEACMDCNHGCMEEICPIAYYGPVFSYEDSSGDWSSSEEDSRENSREDSDEVPDSIVLDMVLDLIFDPDLGINALIDFVEAFDIDVADLIEEHDVLADVCNVTFVLCLRERHYEDLREFGVDCHDAEDLDWWTEMIAQAQCPTSWMETNVPLLCRTSTDNCEEQIICEGGLISIETIEECRDEFDQDARNTLYEDVAESHRSELLDALFGNPRSWSLETVREVIAADLITSLTNGERQQIVREYEGDLGFNDLEAIWADNPETMAATAQEGFNTEDVDCARLPYIVSHTNTLRAIDGSELIACYREDPSLYDGECSALNPLLNMLRQAGATVNELYANEAIRCCLTPAQQREATEDFTSAQLLENPACGSTGRRDQADQVTEDVDATAMTSSELLGMEAFISEISISFLSDIPRDVWEDTVVTLADELSESRAVSQAARESMDDPAFAVASCVTQGMNPRDIGDIAFSDIFSNGDASNFECIVNVPMARMILSRFEDEMEYDDGSSYTVADLRNLNCIVPFAADTRLYADFSDDLVLLVGASARECDLDDEQINALRDRIGRIDDLTESDISSLGYLVPPGDLDNVDCTTSDAVIEGIGAQSAVGQLYAEGRQNLNQLADIVCVDGEHVGLDDGTITDAHVENLGTLACYLNEDRIRNADITGLRSIARLMRDSCMFIVPDATRQAVRETVEELVPVEEFTSTDVQVFVAFDIDITTLPEDLQEEASTARLGYAGASQEQANEREEAGLATEPVASEESLASAVNRIQIAGSGVSRRKRTTSSITCDEINIAGAASVYFSASTLATITDFDNCIDTCGEIEGWSSTQLDELITLAKGIYGNDVSTWTSDQIMTAGTILAGLSVTEIETLVLDSNDIMVVIGEYDIYSSSQLNAGFENYLTRVHGDSETGSGLTSTDLVSLGEFVCGASATLIGNIDDSVYESAMTVIGEQWSCDEARMEAFADKAMDVIGNVEDWTAVDVATVGNMIGGITSADMRSLSETQIDALSAVAVSLVPPNTLAALSTTQIGYLSTVQAEAVTAEQQEEFSNAQLEALEAAGGTIEVDMDVDDESGAGAVQMTYLVTLAALLISFFFGY